MENVVKDVAFKIVDRDSQIKREVEIYRSFGQHGQHGKRCAKISKKN